MKLYRGRLSVLQDGGRLAPLHAELADSVATEEHLALINTLPQVKKPLTANDVFVRGLRLCNDQPFKDGRRIIATDTIPEIAARLRGTPFMVNHDVLSNRALPMGRAFTGYTENVDGAEWATALFYILREQPFLSGDALVNAIDGGQISEASAGLYFDSFTCTLDGKDVGDCDHRPGVVYPEGRCLFRYSGCTEVEEFSAVMSGAVEGTHYFLAAANAHEGAVDADALEAEVLARPKGFFAGLSEQARREEFAREARIGTALVHIAGGFKQAS